MISINNNNNNIHTGHADEGGALEVDEGHAVDARHPLDRQLVLVQPDLMFFNKILITKMLRACQWQLVLVQPDLILLSHFLILYYCLTFWVRTLTVAARPCPAGPDVIQ